MRKNALYLAIAIILLMIPRTNICSMDPTTVIIKSIQKEVEQNKNILAQIKPADLSVGKDWHKFERNKKWFILFEELALHFCEAVNVFIESVRIEGAWYDVVRQFNPNDPLEDFAGFSVILPREKVDHLKDMIEKVLKPGEKLIKNELLQDRQQHKQYNKFKEKIFNLLYIEQDLVDLREIKDFILESTALINEIVKKSLVPNIRMLKKYVDNTSIFNKIEIDSFYLLENDLSDYQSDIIATRVVLFNKLQDYGNYFAQEYIKNGNNMPAKLPEPKMFLFELGGKIIRKK